MLLVQVFKTGHIILQQAGSRTKFPNICLLDEGVQDLGAFLGVGGEYRELDGGVPGIWLHKGSVISVQPSENF